MECELLSAGTRIEQGKYAGHIINKAIQVDNKYVVMTCGELQEHVTVFDADVFEIIQDTKWYLHSTGYIISKSMGMLHALVCPYSEEDPVLSVDHMNRIRTDNRTENLRLATQADQCWNRGPRSDKVPPVDELIAAGVAFLPRGIRRDKTLGRYTCADHAASKKLAADAGRNFVGTRHKDANEIARFKDCLDIYIDVLSNDPEYSEVSEFAYKRIQLATEYNAIIKAAHEFDKKVPTPYADISYLVEDDLTIARNLMETLRNIKVTKGPTEYDVYERFNPNGVKGTIARHKGETMTLYDACFEDAFEYLNWDTDGGAPRIKIPKAFNTTYPDFTIGSLASFIWTQLLKRPIPEGWTVAPLSCENFDVRVDNLRLINKSAAYRVNDHEWDVPDEIKPTFRFAYLPRGISVQKTKVLLNQSAELRPNECGANAKGLWSKTISNTSSVKILLDHAIKILEETHGVAEFAKSNTTYQKLMATYEQAKIKEVEIDDDDE